MKHSPNNPILLSSSLRVDQAREAIADLVNALLIESPLESEIVSLNDALNRVLSEDLLSPIDVPSADNSAMDGYAFDGTCLKSGSGKTQLKIVGTAYAGKPFIGEIAAGECIQIMTGALMPNACDTVIPQEFVTASDREIVFDPSLLKSGDNRRLKGEDLQKNKPAILAGRILRQIWA